MADNDADDAAAKTVAPTDAERGTNTAWLGIPYKPVETFLSVYDAKAGTMVVCHDVTLDMLENRAAALPRGPVNWPREQPEILYGRRELDSLLFHGWLATALTGPTPCLFRLLWLVDDALTISTHATYPRKFMDLADMALRIAATIEARTSKPYRVSFRDNPALDPAILKVPPMDRLPDWQRFADLRSGRARSAVTKDTSAAKITLEDREAWADLMDKFADELRNTIGKGRIAVETRGTRTPVISRALATLRGLTFGDAGKSSHLRVTAQWADKPIGSTVGIILYSSVYSVVLDGRGEPVTLPGIAPYSLLIQGPGENMLRRLPHPGLYVSLGILASYQLRVTGPHKTQVLVHGSMFGLQREVMGFSRQGLGAEASTHPLQNRLQNYLDRTHRGHTLVSIVTPDAFASGSLSFARLKSTIYKLIPLMAEFALKYVKAELAKLPETYKDKIAQIAADFIPDAVKDAVRAWAINWLIKKVGKTIIPGVNLISAIADAIDDDGDAERIRNIAACLTMATLSGKSDDMVITSKILSKIAVNEVGKRIVQKVIAETGKQVSKQVGKRMAARDTGQIETDQIDAPDVEGAPPPRADAPVPSAPETLPPEMRAPAQNPPRAKALAPNAPDPGADPRGKEPPKPPASSPPADPDAARNIQDRGLGKPEEAAEKRGVAAKTRANTPSTEAPQPAAKKTNGTPPTRRRGAEAAEAKKHRDAEKAEGDALLKRAKAHEAAMRAEDARARGETAADTDLRETHDAHTEGTGTGQARKAIGHREKEDQGLGVIDKPKKGEPTGKDSGLIGEGREQENAGIKREVPEYSKAISGPTKKDLRREILVSVARGKRDGLIKFAEKIGLSKDGLREVEIPAPHGTRKVRRYDRAYRDDKGVVLVEAKNYMKSTLRPIDIKQQLANDQAIMQSHDVRIEMYLEGNVHPDTMDRLNRIEKKFPEQFLIRKGETFEYKPKREALKKYRERRRKGKEKK
ncbi:hypothetical protein [Hydrogenophaga sp. PAMC20947]|uniref:hypothetical protein n=1 Tax=Hydrogenophaga sp. PAMC20947 TaxID=2565558 RepID=UPI00109DEABC|nr:hypothetical protein [Hydrogenophaga sp. PAMC20947]QCB44900.1 hypothetical protein E5678_01915 [Hydrogenophaga sp. PAMC20947]